MFYELNDRFSTTRERCMTDVDPSKYKGKISAKALNFFFLHAFLVVGKATLLRGDSL
jgi:hypothetical protein